MPQEPEQSESPYPTQNADQENTEPEQFQAMDTTESSTNRFSLMPTHKKWKNDRNNSQNSCPDSANTNFLQASQTLRSEAT